MNSQADTAEMSLAREAEIFEHWISLISLLEKRVYCREQSAESFLSLKKLAKDFKPTVIVELGTLSGLSLRAWLGAAPEAKVKTVDLNFDALKRSANIIPFETARLTLIKENILKVDFKKLWGPSDRVLFFVGAHDLPGVPIIDHAIKNAFPYLPVDNLIIVDDIWYCPETVTPDNANIIFRRDILSNIDELQTFEACYAPYHRTGFFWGGCGVHPLLKFINQHGISLRYSANIKNICFNIKQLQKINFNDGDYVKQCGSVSYHPLEIGCSEDSLTSKILEQTKKLYVKNEVGKAIELLTDTVDKASVYPGLAYAMGVCFARIGEIDKAQKALTLDPETFGSYPGSKRLFNHIESQFGRLRATGKNRKPGITLVTVPKAFKGHIDIIQRNALGSWCRLEPRPEILVMGDDEGVEDVCREFNIRHIPTLKRNEMGTPLFDEIIFKAQEESSTELLAYVNSDIILFNSFVQASALASHRFEDFLLVGQRLDYEQKELVDYSSDWIEPLLDMVVATGYMRPATAMDYFVFKPGLWPYIPPFALGRFYWDTWLLNDALQREAAVIDCTAYVNILHQKHDYSHVPGVPDFSIKSNNTERARNLALMGCCKAGFCTFHSNWLMLNNGRIVPRDF